MAGIVFGTFCVLSVLCACFTGNLSVCGDALFSGAQDAVTLILSLGGAMCLWCGLLEVFREMGAADALQQMLMPLLRFLFPNAAQTGVGMNEIAASLSANLLGIGNAATPLGLRAMEMLRGDRKDGTMTPDMEMLVVLNTAPPTLLPTTLLTLRHAAGSANAAAVLPAIWITSLLGCVFAVIVMRALSGHAYASSVRADASSGHAVHAGSVSKKQRSAQSTRYL